MLDPRPSIRVEGPNHKERHETADRAGSLSIGYDTPEGRCPPRRTYAAIVPGRFTAVGSPDAEEHAAASVMGPGAPPPRHGAPACTLTA